MEDRLIICPAPCFFMIGSVAAIPCNTPRIFTSIMRFHSSTLSSSSLRERHHPGVIHDYVDSATSFQTELDKRLDILKGCDVQSPVFSSSAIITELFCDCFQPLC